LSLPAITRLHSISSSARKRTEGGIVNPMAFAALTLRSNLFTEHQLMQQLQALGHDLGIQRRDARDDVAARPVQARDKP